MKTGSELLLHALFLGMQLLTLRLEAASGTGCGHIVPLSCYQKGEFSDCSLTIAWCTSLFSITVIKCLKKNSLTRQRVFGFTLLQGRSRSWWGRHGSRQGRHGGWRRKLAGHILSALKKQRAKEGPGYKTSTCFQQHTLSNKGSAPKSFVVFLDSTASRDQIFKHMSLWGCFTFKPGQWYLSSQSV